MNSSTLNIVELIENNPITKLSSTYNSKLLTKIKNNFTNFEQQLFVSSFYCYLNCHSTNDFVIYLDDFCKLLDFSTKQKAKTLLEKIFVPELDYTILLNPQVKQVLGDNKNHGGHNIKKFMLSVKTFKSFCLKAGTEKADEIHEYYIKLEDTLHEIISEESAELKLQLENQTIKSENEKIKLREKTLLEQFPPNTQCVYYGLIDNLSDANEPLIKFGNSNNLRNRVLQHRETYNNFRLTNAFKVNNKFEIESAIKRNPIFNTRLRSLSIKNKKFIELLCIDGLTYCEIDNIIQEIIKGIECTPENYKRLLDENSSFRKQLYEKGNIDNSNQVLVLTTENKRLTKENSILVKKIKQIEKKLLSWKNAIGLSGNINSDDEDEYDYNQEITTHNTSIITPFLFENAHSGAFSSAKSNGSMRIFNAQRCKKNTSKQKDGKYHIDNHIYNKLIGTRQDVWDGNAYKTSGGLLKSDLTINNNGKIVSFNKSISEKLNNKFEHINLLKQLHS
jgi:hypothetical protein